MKEKNIFESIFFNKRFIFFIYRYVCGQHLTDTSLEFKTLNLLAKQEK